MSTNQESKNEDQKALDELVSEFEKALQDLELPDDEAVWTEVRKETQKFLAELVSEQNESGTKAVKFDRNDEATFPKQEGCYFAYNEAGICFVAFWAEFMTFRSEFNSLDVIRKRRWITDYEVAMYCPIPLSQLCKSI